MEMKKLNDNRIKIVLSNQDLKKFNLDFNAIAYNSPKMQKFFWNVMKQAESEFGFNLENSHFFIEARADCDDSLVIFVTKLDDEFSLFPPSLSKKKYVKMKAKSTVISNSFAKAIYKTNSFDTICNVAGLVKGLYHGDSSLYKFHDDYYLVSYVNAVLPEDRVLFDTTFKEYTRKIDNDMMIQGMLSEYGTKLIDKNALDVVQKYFVN